MGGALADVREVLAEIARRLGGGERLSAEGIVAEFPDQAEELRKALPKLFGVMRELGFNPEEVPAPPAPVPLLLGKYEVLEEIGRGGMGVVCRARHRELGRDVALKILPPGLLRRKGAEERFRHEASVAARLNHPNLVTMFEFGEEGGTPYYAMELVEGSTLSEQIERDRASGAMCPACGPRERLDALLLRFAELADGVEEAHRAGILHRDIKPANVLVTKEGVMKLADFGLAKDLQADRISRSAETVGTLLYMGPLTECLVEWNLFIFMIMSMKLSKVQCLWCISFTMDKRE